MISTIFYYLYWVLTVYFYIIIASILMSWVPELKKTTIGQLIERIANPFMRIFRGILVIGMFDLTPMVGIFLFQIGLKYLGEMVNLMASQGL